MLSILVRGIINIVITIFLIGLILFYKERKYKADKICYSVIVYYAYVFPFIELSKDFYGFKIGPLYCGILLLWFLTPRLWQYIIKPKLNPIIILIFIIFTCALLSEYRLLSFVGAIKYFIYILLFVTTLFACRYKGGYALADKVFLIISCWIILFAFIQIFITPEFSFYYFGRSTEDRMGFCFDNAQSAGLGCAWLCVYYFNKYLIRNKRDPQTICLIFIMLLLAAYTGSKTAIFGIIGGFALCGWYAKLSFSNIFLIIFGGVVIVYTYPLWSQMSIIERMNDFDESLEIRQVYFWGGGLKIFEDNWLTGIGPGVFQKYNELHHINLIHRDYGTTIYATQPENGYLFWLDEFGILAIWPIILIASLLRFKTKSALNFSLIIPWALAFVSFANIERTNIGFMLMFILGLVNYSNQTKGKIHINHENIDSWKN